MTMKALLTLAAVLAPLVVATPLALGASTPQRTTFITDPVGQGSPHAASNPTAQNTRQTGPRAPSSSPSSAFTTDTLAPGGTAPVQSYRFITDTLATGGGPVVAAPVAGGFDWADAGIGAAATAGLMLLLLGSARVMQQHRRRLAAA
jgi:hypothetical protein